MAAVEIVPKPMTTGINSADNVAPHAGAFISKVSCIEFFEVVVLNDQRFRRLRAGDSLVERAGNPRWIRRTLWYFKIRT